MTIRIPDHILKEAGLTEREATIEFGCHLFNRQVLSLRHAAQVAGLSRINFENECLDRGIPVYRYDVDDFAADLEAIDHLRRMA